ncbi:hypothetical protein LXL04_006673 [Taraxacum kok-saghyz]
MAESTGVSTVHERGNVTLCPKLTETNYTSWSINCVENTWPEDVAKYEKMNYTTKTIICAPSWKMFFCRLLLTRMQKMFGNPFRFGTLVPNGSKRKEAKDEGQLLLIGSKSSEHEDKQQGRGRGFGRGEKRTCMVQARESGRDDNIRFRCYIVEHFDTLQMSVQNGKTRITKSM